MNRKLSCAVLELGVRAENGSWRKCVNNCECDGITLRLKSLKKKLNEEELNGMTLLRQMKRPNQEVEPLGREKKLLRHTIETMWNSAMREAVTTLAYVKQLPKALEPH